MVYGEGSLRNLWEVFWHFLVQRYSWHATYLTVEKRDCCWMRSLSSGFLLSEAVSGRGRFVVWGEFFFFFKCSSLKADVVCGSLCFWGLRSLAWRGPFLEQMCHFRWVRKSGQIWSLWPLYTLSHPIWKTCLNSSVNVSENFCLNMLSGWAFYFTCWGHFFSPWFYF